MKDIFSKGSILKKSLALSIAIIACGYGAQGIFAQTSQSVFYVPLIGITSVPNPFALPKGAGNVTYHYAVKNFLTEVPLTDVSVSDDSCSPVTFVEGDDNSDSKLDYSETWRYACTTKISTTTQSVATAVGTANNMTATHKAYATVVVGSDNVPPLVSIINITKVASPLSLPAQGGPITFTYRVNNPGIVPLSGVSVVDDKCIGMSGKLGDTNGNNLLDINEVWVYTCTTILKQTTTNTVVVTAYANGFKAMSSDTITVNVKAPVLPELGSNPSTDSGTNPNLKIIAWAILAVILAALSVFALVTRKIGKRQ